MMALTWLFLPSQGHFHVHCGLLGDRWVICSFWCVLVRDDSSGQVAAGFGKGGLAESAGETASPHVTAPCHPGAAGSTGGLKTELSIGGLDKVALELLTLCGVEAAPADEGAAEFEEGFVDVVADLPADA
jgi:hypothetical protein